MEDLEAGLALGHNFTDFSTSSGTIQDDVRSHVTCFNDARIMRLSQGLSDIWR